MARLADWLRGHGQTVVATREPGGSPGAEEIRALFVSGGADRWDGATEALLVSAARRDHVRKTILPALESGAWVLCDRFADSTLAYQGYGRGQPLPMLRSLQEIATDGLLPSLTLWLDLPLEEGLRRAAQRRGGEARFEGLDLGFHRRVAEGFAALAAAEPSRFRRIDADGTPEAVSARIAAAICAHFPDLA
ncbi:dTMP kinase [Elstera litoralis]|uniref:dTMP kinase n=1 Tax=Elstera litoralis TaxID=552518 RepID=UPI001E6319D6|nr:dTMP kinase [Elstera litoralis]